MSTLLLRNVELGGAITDVHIVDGKIASIAPNQVGGESIDARGGALIPGLADHHIHLFATAAKMASLDLTGVRGKETLQVCVREACARCPAGDWLRAINYDDTHIGLLSRRDLDAASPDHPVRVQDRTGALWVLNTRALDLVIEGEPPSCVERDETGAPTGRIWRGDAWLRERIGATPPSLHTLSRALASCGVTHITETGVTNGPREAGLLADARRSGELAQHLTLMSGGEIQASNQYEIGPIKILPDERDLPDIDAVIAKIALARRLNRAVAVHCVTATELALSLAAFETAGACPGDRIEHGSVIPAAALDAIRALGLTVVSQPHFVRERGDRYLATVDAADQPDLYRLNSILAHDIPLAAGSDAPYGSIDPWRAIAAAKERRTEAGLPLGAEEKLCGARALDLYLTSPSAPGSAPRKVEAGAPADLCLLNVPLAEALAAPSSDYVAATIINGAIAYRHEN